MLHTLIKHAFATNQYILKNLNLLNINHPDKFWFLVGGIKQGIGRMVRRVVNSSWILRALFLRMFGWFQIDFFARGKTNVFQVKARDVGEPLLVTLKKGGGHFLRVDSDWFVNRVKIEKVGTGSDITYDFPCNRLMQNESVTLFEGKGKPCVLNKKLETNTRDGFFLNHFSLVIRIHVLDVFIFTFIIIIK